MKKDIVKSKEYEFTTLYEPVKEGGYQVIVPSLPGLITYGRNIEEAKEMARDAINCHIQGLLEEKTEIPKETKFIQEKIMVSV